MASLAKQDLQLGFQLRPAQLVMVHGAATKARAMGLHFTVTELNQYPVRRAQTAILMLSPSKKNTPLVYPSYRTIKKKTIPLRIEHTERL